MEEKDDFGELILLLGDIHVPTRRPCIPKVFENLLNTNKIKYVLCTGNIGSSFMLDRIRNIAANVYISQGDMDFDTEFPEYHVIQFKNLTLGLIHGHQLIPDQSEDALSAWQRKLSCDVLIYGSTHKMSAQKIHGKVFLNPGSITGAYSPKGYGSPSFMLMSVRATSATVYCYELDEKGSIHVTLSQLMNHDSNASEGQPQIDS